MKKQRIRWLHYLSVDAKAAEAELNALAARGWSFEGSFWGFARFSAVEGLPPRYCVEPCINTISSESESTPGYTDYIRLCADAGWELLEENASLRIFRSAPGADFPPVQTDPALDYEANWDGILRKQTWNAVLCIALWAVNYFRIARSSSLASPAELLLLAILIFPMLGELFYVIYLTRRRSLCRKAIRGGEALPESAPLAAKLRGLAPIALLTVFLLALLCLFLPMPR